MNVNLILGAYSIGDEEEKEYSDLRMISVIFFGLPQPFGLFIK